MFRFEGVRTSASAVVALNPQSMMVLTEASDLGLRISGVGFPVEGLIIRFKGVSTSATAIIASATRESTPPRATVQGLAFRVSGFSFQLQFEGFRVKAAGFRI